MIFSEVFWAANPFVNNVLALLLTQNVNTQGELAVSFGDLLRKLWAPGRNPVAPRPFKAKVARFAPQFSGNNQHDSQVWSIA